ncbi:hypothetical protein DFS34DRAFT_631771 [Phlyctochytrium arcticum]|nr:hypothetical protein DFS34DRAFT_631771 [Phlyctochytrium arcticum]
MGSDRFSLFQAELSKHDYQLVSPMHIGFTALGITPGTEITEEIEENLKLCHERLHDGFKNKKRTILYFDLGDIVRFVRSINERVVQLEWSTINNTNIYKHLERAGLFDDADDCPICLTRDDRIRIGCNKCQKAICLTCYSKSDLFCLKRRIPFRCSLCNDLKSDYSTICIHTVCLDEDGTTDFADDTTVTDELVAKNRSRLSKILHM